MSSVFAKIIQGEIPCYKITENHTCIAFLDIFPIKEGHVLVVPKKEINHWSDLDADTLQSVMLLSQQIANAIKKTFSCERVGVVVAGFDVPHCHVHLIPSDKMADLDFSNPKLKISSQRFQEIASLIAQNL
jgi:histidine triad (HIT) family protein